jgi:hypothetical protein
MNPALEQQLLKRLTMLGCVLLSFAVIAVVFDFLPKAEEEIFLLEEEEQPEPLNPYLVSASFTVVGALCLFVAWKKRKKALGE